MNIFTNTQIDLSFAALAMQTVTEDVDFSDDHILDNVDEESVRSLNGRRVNDMLLKLTPDVDKFRVVLRFIRIWAKKRFVYGNVFGYLGGVNLAILAAFACQRYPNKSPAFIIMMLFHDLATWQWPEPIYINNPSTGNRPNWDQAKPQERKEFMPIITPAYPTINSLRSATRSTRNRMVHEFKRGFNKCREIILNGSLWDSLISYPTFFVRYAKYVEINVFGATQESVHEFVGFVQSRLRHLITSLEAEHLIKFAMVFPNEFKTPNYRGHEICSSYYIALTFHTSRDENQTRTIDLSPAARNWVNEIRPKAPEGTDLGLEIIDRSDLPSHVFPDGEKPEIKSSVKRTGAE